MRNRDRPPEVVRLSVEEIAELTASALERDDFDRAVHWLGLILARNDPDDLIETSGNDLGRS